MYHQCPHCGSFDTRRSRAERTDDSIRRVFRSPYRCRRCHKLFWAASSRGYRFAIFVAVATITVVAGVGLFAAIHYQEAVPGEAPPEVAVIDETTSLARQGDALAEHELARRYAAGRGVPQSDHERMLWLVRAAEHGNVDAQYELGMALRHGHGTVQDFVRSAHWLQRAAERGNALAQYELGLLYRSGTGIAPDNVKAYTWLNLAAAQGVAGAATARDAVLRQLSPAETRDAQTEARRLSEVQQQPPSPPAR
ncbi:MAG: SEL1-like repeat protein [Betaproteobacteria bacterium]|nr:SEL1-like repeat protein [Betaproteobacteria bacterium]